MAPALLNSNNRHQVMSRTPGQKPPIASNDSQSRSTNDSTERQRPTQEKINPFEDENNEDDLFGIEFDRIRHTTTATTSSSSSNTAAAHLNMSTSSSSSNSNTNTMKANPSNTTSEQLLLSFDDPYRSGCGVTIPSSLHLLQPSSSPLLPSSPASSPSPSSQLLINLSGPITSLPPPHPLHIGSSISNSTSPNSSSPNQSNNTLSSANSRQIYHQANNIAQSNYYNPYNPTPPTNHYRTHVKSNSCSNIGGNYNLMMMMNKPPTIGEVSPNIDAGIVSYLNSKARTGNNNTTLNVEPNSARTNRQSSGSSSSSIYVTHFWSELNQIISRSYYP